MSATHVNIIVGLISFALGACIVGIIIERIHDIDWKKALSQLDEIRETSDQLRRVSFESGVAVGLKSSSSAVKQSVADIAKFYPRAHLCSHRGRYSPTPGCVCSACMCADGSTDRDFVQMVNDANDLLKVAAEVRQS